MRLDAIAVHRAAARCANRGIPVLPRMLDWLIFLVFNSVIHHGTSIGSGTACAYRGMSVLVHKQAVIGRDVLIGPHVVLGGRSGQKPPVIGDGVYIGANACVLGGVHVGDNAVVGAGSVVLADVAAGAVVAGNPAGQLEAGHGWRSRSTGRAGLPEGGTSRPRAHLA